MSWPRQFSLRSRRHFRPSVTSEQNVCVMCSQRLPAVLSRIGIILASPLVRLFATFIGTFQQLLYFFSLLYQNQYRLHDHFNLFPVFE